MPPTGEQEKYAQDLEVDVTWSDTADVPRQIMNFPLEKYHFAGESNLAVKDKAECVLTHIEPLFANKGSFVDSKIHFVLRRETKDKTGVSTLRYKIFHKLADGKKIPIVFGETTIRLNMSTCYRILSNGVRTDVKLKGAMISKDQAEKNISDYLNELDYEFNIYYTELCILKIGTSYLMAWDIKVNIWRVDPTQSADFGSSNRLHMYIDVEDGKLVKVHSDLAKTIIDKSIVADGKYSGLNQSIRIMSEKKGKIDDVLMWDKYLTIPGLQISINDATNQYQYGSAVQNPIRIPSKNVTPIYDKGREEIDCLNYSRIVFQYFYDRHGRLGYDDSGSNCIVEAHFGKKFDMGEALWDENSIKISDESPYYYAFCTLDTIAHEWTHGINSIEANLNLLGEQGALCEAICDAFSFFVREWYKKKGGSLSGSKWMLGQDLPKNTKSRGCVRNMEDPSDNGRYQTVRDNAQGDAIKGALEAVKLGLQPDTMADYLKIDEIDWNEKTDQGGVHVNCGILNKAFYLMLTGGTFSINGNSVNIGDPIEPEVLEILYYHALVHDLDPMSTFQEFAEYLVQSVDSQYKNVNVPDIDDFMEAWKDTITNAVYAVGIWDKCVTTPKNKPPTTVDWENVM